MKKYFYGFAIFLIINSAHADMMLIASTGEVGTLESEKITNNNLVEISHIQKHHDNEATYYVVTQNPKE